MTIPKTMKAAVVVELGKPLVVREHSVPQIGPWQVLVQVRASGVCHTDLHAAMGDWPVKPAAPFVPGHKGADEDVNAAKVDPVKEVTSHLGGVHGALVTAVSTRAFAQATGMLRRHGTMSLVGLPPGDFPLPILEVVLKRLTIRGSIVGTRLDLAEALVLAAEGLIKTMFSWDKLDHIKAIFVRMQEGNIEGRVVLEI